MIVGTRATFVFAFAVAYFFAAAQRPDFGTYTQAVTHWGTATDFAVINTREGKQIVDPSGGPLLGYPENPKIMPYNYSPLPPTRIRPGGLLKDQRSVIDVFWPGISQDQWRPPDCTIAVGPNHIVATVNMKIAFFAKDGTLQFLKWLGNQQPDGFFVPVGALNFTFDPKCFYDRGTGRFFVVVPEMYSNPQSSFVNVAVSDDSDPHGTWYLYRTNSLINIGGSNCWLDYPGWGVDDKALYVTGNMFAFGSGFRGVLFRGIPKAPLLNGGTLTFFDFVDTNSGSVQCAESVGVPQAGFFVNVWNTSTLQIHAIRNPLGSPTKTSIAISVPSFLYPNSDAPQQGSSALLDTIDGRIMNVYWRDGRLIATHAVRTSASGNRTIARWYEFNTADWPNSGTVTLVQSGNVDPGNMYMLFPAVAFNDFNDMGMVVGGSSSEQFAAVYTTGRRKTDPAGMMGALTLAKMGSAAYTGERWGDYFGIQVDPVDGLTFWGVGEYCDSPTQWKTWVASWRVATYRELTIAANGDIVANLIGVPITVTPDGRGLGNGPTPFKRTYYEGTPVTLQAPQNYQAFFNYSFVRWRVNGVDQPLGQQSISVTLSSNTYAEAVYIPSP